MTELPAESTSELECLFVEAHCQLLARDAEIQRLANPGRLLGNPAVRSTDTSLDLDDLTEPGSAEDLHTTLAEQTAWAQRATRDVIERDNIIRGLQASVAEQKAWAQRSADAVLERDAIIQQLQASLAEQTAWAQRSAEEVAKRDQIILGLSGRLPE